MPNYLSFCDSNIWLYRFLVDSDSDSYEEIKKHDIATNLTNRENIVISTQVINEVCAVLCKKAKLSEIKIRQVIEEFYQGCIVMEIDRNIIVIASDLRTQYSLSFWDSLIVASALSVDANILYSDSLRGVAIDMQDGLIISGQLTIINPFKL
jgi:predicted nucleic acid-binding protein